MVVTRTHEELAELRVDCEFVGLSSREIIMFLAQQLG